MGCDCRTPTDDPLSLSKHETATLMTWLSPIRPKRWDPLILTDKGLTVVYVIFDRQLNPNETINQKAINYIFFLLYFLYK